MVFKLLALLPLLVGVVSCSGGSKLSSTTNQSDQQSNVEQILPLVVTELIALHRHGQTFLVWPEGEGSNFHVYRHSSPITIDNLNSATRLTERWGSLDSNTSRNIYRSVEEPSHFVVEDLGTPLSDKTGLFVHTVQEGQSGNTYYAVTTINGAEETIAGRNSLETPVNESVESPTPVLVSVKNNGKGRLYTHYMDYQNWNPTLNGYAFSYTIALPSNYDASRSYPLQISLHAFGEDLNYPSSTEDPDWEYIQLFPHDPGELQQTIHTWWYGYAADHNYQTQGQVPASGTVVNFTEQRILKAMQEAIDNSGLNVDEGLIHVIGNSMGASGAFSLGMRYPNIFSGIYASQPMIDYASSPTFENNFIQLWGQKQTNLQIQNRGDDAAVIRRYGAEGSTPVSVWSWMNHLEQLTQRSSDGFAFLAVDHGKADTTIDWQTQGKPLVAALTDAHAGFTANATGGTGHAWQSFDAVVKRLFGLGFGGEAPWRYPLELSFPSITNATASGQIPPADNGSDSYNTDIDWSTAENNFHEPIFDTPSVYEISLRSDNSAQTANITPRRTTLFRPSTGTQCQWTATANSNGQLLASGSSSVEDEIVTALGVPINTTPGTRLRISC